ncbi:hypothetical protein [Methylomagnum ishizawai]|uniref:hypothetical protein n=1 Tax=Methylomagnum ishizawai TaxID=1760988 RepID=UPI001C337664|nr:hypothetical protein [Methylomagnum ishizawai]BBL73235.1 hypothetical protein MishRS11D_03330 [Methylomagnum ishizawai]
MSYKYALICMHGMGNLTQNEFMGDIAKVRRKLAHIMPAQELSNVYIPPGGIFYSFITQGQEDKVWEKMNTQGGLDTGWIRRNTVNRLRRFIISGLSDATAFTGFNGSGTASPYRQAQEVIGHALENVFQVCGSVPVILLSHSLGCQIMSSYLWDAQLYWRNTREGENFPIDSRSVWYNRAPAADDYDGFMALRTLKTWFTTGCNIPIFVSGFDDVRAVETHSHGYDFTWINYFDYDDILGYPLAPLSVLFDAGKPTRHGQPYASAVTDIQVNATDGVMGAILSSWNPMSHTQYWGDGTVMTTLANSLK